MVICHKHISLRWHEQNFNHSNVYSDKLIGWELYSLLGPGNPSTANEYGSIEGDYAHVRFSHPPWKDLNIITWNNGSSTSRMDWFP